MPKEHVNCIQTVLSNDKKLSNFKNYLEIHVEIDGSNHSKPSSEMVKDLCNDNPVLGTLIEYYHSFILRCCWKGYCNLCSNIYNTFNFYISV
jgi:hypothetical protein